MLLCVVVFCEFCVGKGCSLLLLFSKKLEILTRTVKEEKETEDIQMGKKELNARFTDVGSSETLPWLPSVHRRLLFSKGLSVSFL